MRLTRLLEDTWQTPFTTKSNTAREYADEIALAASLGYLTTQKSTVLFGRTWLITALGLDTLNGGRYDKNSNT